MIDYKQVAELIKACSWIHGEAEKLRQQTFAKILGVEDLPKELAEENLTSVWNTKDLTKLKELGYLDTDEETEYLHTLEENLQILAKDHLLRELDKQVKLAEKDCWIPDLKVGTVFKVNDTVGEVTILDFVLYTGVYDKHLREGVILCQRYHPYQPFVVWKYTLTDKTIDCYSGEYFKTLEDAQEYFSTHSV